MFQKIQALDDATAIRVLTTIAQAHADTALTDTKLAPDFQDVLKSEFELETAAGSVSDGEMARQALQLLAQDPDMHDRITGLAEKPPDLFMEPVTGMLLAGAVLFVLKTHFEFKYENGKTTLIIKSKPLDKQLLKGFTQKLLTWLPGGPFK